MAIIPDFSSVDATTAMIGLWILFLLYAVLHSPVLFELVRCSAPAAPPAPMGRLVSNAKYLDYV